MIIRHLGATMFAMGNSARLVAAIAGVKSCLAVVVFTFPLLITLLLTECLMALLTSIHLSWGDAPCTGLATNPCCCYFLGL